MSATVLVNEGFAANLVDALDGGGHNHRGARVFVALQGEALVFGDALADLFHADALPGLGVVDFDLLPADLLVVVHGVAVFVGEDARQDGDRDLGFFGGLFPIPALGFAVAEQPADKVALLAWQVLPWKGSLYRR
jgi:hypothetical protein